VGGGGDCARGRGGVRVSGFAVPPVARGAGGGGGGDILSAELARLARVTRLECVGEGVLAELESSV
jgi:hypothetical protein